MYILTCKCPGVLFLLEAWELFWYVVFWALKKKMLTVCHASLSGSNYSITLSQNTDFLLLFLVYCSCDDVTEESELQGL